MTNEWNDYPIIALPGSGTWRDAYEWGNSLGKAFPDGEAYDFAYAVRENIESAPKDALEFGITSLVCEQVGENDGESWVWVVQFANGETWRIEGWCDYTGWDCQSGISCTQITKETS